MFFICVEVLGQLAFWFWRRRHRSQYQVKWCEVLPNSRQVLPSSVRFYQALTSQILPASDQSCPTKENSSHILPNSHQSHSVHMNLARCILWKYYTWVYLLFRNVYSFTKTCMIFVYTCATGYEWQIWIQWLYSNIKILTLLVYNCKMVNLIKFQKCQWNPYISV